LLSADAPMASGAVSPDSAKQPYHVLIKSGWPILATMPGSHFSLSYNCVGPQLSSQYEKAYFFQPNG
jgi:hypothetical protein